MQLVSPGFNYQKMNQLIYLNVSIYLYISINLEIWMQNVSSRTSQFNFKFDFQYFNSSSKCIILIRKKGLLLYELILNMSSYSDSSLFWDANILKTQEIMTLFKQKPPIFKIVLNLICWSPNLILLLDSKNRGPLINPLVTSRLYMPEIFKCKFSAKNIKWELLGLFVVFIYQPKKHLSKDLAPQHIRFWRKLQSKLKKWKKSGHFQKWVANFLFMTNYSNSSYECLEWCKLYSIL